MNPSIYRKIIDIWRSIFGAPEQHRQYFRTAEDIEIAIDWGRREMKITGAKIIRASDTEAMWIRHIARAGRENNIVRNIDV